jgi:hypothetical protein
MFEIAARDLFAVRMRSKPAGAFTKKFFDFVFTNPVVLFVVENGEKNVKMLQNVAKFLFRGERNAPVAAFSPFGKVLIKSEPCGRDCVAERLKEAAQKIFAAAAGYDGNVDLQGKLSFSKLLAIFATASKCSAEGTRQSDTRKRRGSVRAIVDVLIEESTFTRWAAGFANEFDGIDFDKKCGSAALFSGFRIENVSFAK